MQKNIGADGAVGNQKVVYLNSENITAAAAAVYPPWLTPAVDAQAGEAPWDTQAPAPAADAPAPVAAAPVAQAPAATLPWGAPTVWTGGPLCQEWSDYPDTVTFMCCSGTLATKRFTSNGKGGYEVNAYSNGKMFQWAQVPVIDLDGLYQDLTSASQHSDVLLVSGKVKQPAHGDYCIRRMMHDKRDSGGNVTTRAPFYDAPNRMVCFDVDTMEMPAELSWADPESIARFVWLAMAAAVPQMADVSFIWQASSSAGMTKPHDLMDTERRTRIAKMHFFALLEEPITAKQRQALYKAAGSDPALHSAVQVHYIAAPIFEGVIDPLADVPRMGIVHQGRSHIAADGLPVEVVEEKAIRSYARAKETSSVAYDEAMASEPMRSDETTEAGAEVLDRICRLPTTAGHNRNTLIFSRARELALYVNGGSIEESEALARLTNAARACGHEDWERPMLRGWSDGLFSGHILMPCEISDAAVFAWIEASLEQTAAREAAARAANEAYLSIDMPEGFEIEGDMPDIAGCGEVISLTGTHYIADDAQRMARVQEESEKLTKVIDSFVEKHASAARAVSDLKSRYAQIHDSLEADIANGAVSEDDAVKHRAKAQRAARREVTAKHSLDDLASTRRRANGADDTTQPVGEHVYSRIAITGAQGIGKSAGFVGSSRGAGALHTKALGAVTLFLSPDNARSAAAYSDYVDATPPTGDHPQAILLKGRSAAVEVGSDAKMCEIPSTAEAAGRAGVNVRSALCMNCRFADSCAYMQQEERIAELASDPRGAVIFTTHPYLTLPLPNGVEPDVVVCDESPAGAFVEKAVISVDDLDCVLLSPKADKHTMDAVEGLRADLEGKVMPLMAAIKSEVLVDRAGLLDVLRMNSITSSRLGMAVSILEGFKTAAAAKVAREAGESAEQMDARGAELFSGEAIGRASRLATLCQALAVEIDHKHPTPISVVWRTDGLHVWLKKDLHHKNAALAYLDGTMNQTLAAAQFGALATYTFAVPRNARVTQSVGKTFSTTALVGVGKPDVGAAVGGAVGTVGLVEADSTIQNRKYAAELRSSVRKIISNHAGCFVASTKRGLSALELNGMDCQTAHFGGLRGSNAYAGASAAVVVGRLQPPVSAIEDEARAYAAITGELIEAQEMLTKVPCQIADANGDLHSLTVDRHPHGLVEAIRSQKAEAEVEQAVDRLRLIHNHGAAREVILLNSCPSIAVDRVIEWKDLKEGGSKLERFAAKYGFLVQSPSEAFRIAPDLFGSLDTTKREVAASLGNNCWGEAIAGDLVKILNGANSYKDSIEFCTIKETEPKIIWKVVYKVVKSSAQKRIHAQTAYLEADTMADAQTIIERTVGELQSFEALDTITLAPAVNFEPAETSENDDDLDELNEWEW